MIVGLGIDLIAIEKLSADVKSEAFRRKVFTSAEIKSCEAIRNLAECLAGKFAVKEAFMKAIGRGIRQEVWFTQIEVLNRESGEPYILAHRNAEQALKELHVKNIHISISHTDGMAVAVVVLEK